MKRMGEVLKAAAYGLAFAIPAFASTVNVDVTEEHQVIRGFGGMVHNQWQGGGGLSEADAKLAFGTGDGQIGLNTLRIPVYASSNDFNKEVQAAKYAKKYAGDDFILCMQVLTTSIRKFRLQSMPKSTPAMTLSFMRLRGHRRTQGRTSTWLLRITRSMWTT